MNGGEALVQTLLAHEATVGFGVPGESYLAVLEAMRRSGNRFRYVNSRHESGAAFAADAYGRLTGRPGIAFVTRGPGACNASIAVHTAHQDSTPIVLFVGQVPTRELGREAFQEVDYQRMFSGLAKAVIEPLRASDVAEATARALRLATSGRAGPVVVVLPEDVTEGDAGEVTVPASRPRAPMTAGPEAIGRARALIAAAERPLLVAGERVSIEGASEALRRFAEASGCGVVSGFRRQDALDNAHPAYLGTFGLGRPPYIKQLAQECDVVVLAGARPDAVTSDEYRFPGPDKQVVHIYPDADAMHQMRAPDVALVADLAPTLQALAEGLPAPPEARLAWRAGHRASYEAYSGRAGHAARGAVDMAEVVVAMRRILPADAILTNDAGNFSTWLHRYYHFHSPRSLAGPGSGAMGYAVPAGVGAKLAWPERTVVAFVGDGGFWMTGMELATACQEGLPIKVLVVDNANYGTIWMHQHETYGPGSGFGVGLDRADLAAVARGFGAAAWTVERTAEFEDALRAALAHDGPALLHLVTDPRDISAGRSIDLP